MKTIRLLLLNALFTLSLTAPTFAQGDGNVGNLETDPYANDGQWIRENLPVKKDALLPDIIYPYLPSGNMLTNAGIGTELKNAPNIGAIESTIIYLSGAFKGTGKAGEAGKVLWRLAIGFTTFGLLLSGFMTYKAVTMGKTSMGEASIGLLMKFIMCTIMLSAVAPNLPPMLIGLTNAVTKNIADWFSFTNAGGTLGGQEAIDSLNTKFKTKCAAATAAAGAVNELIMQAAATTVQNDPNMADVIANFTTKMKADTWIRQATGGQDSGGVYFFDEHMPTIRKMLDGSKTPKQINAEMSKLASIAPSVVLNRADAYLGQAMKDVDEAKRPGANAIIEAITKAPQNVDISGFSIPNRVLTTYAYIAFGYLAISIWGMGFAALIWTMLYAMPDEWELKGALSGGFKGSITILLSAVLIAIYLSAGLNFAHQEAGKIIENTNTATQTLYDWTLGWIPNVWDGIKAGAKGVTEIVGFGNISTNLMGWFNDFTLDQFILGMLILTAPAQAALMIKGANGIGEQASKALTANNAANQGTIASVFGAQATQGSGATASTGSPGGIMQGQTSGIDRSTMLRPNRK